jgi:DNA-binding MarR family transcriptional regulator
MPMQQALTLLAVAEQPGLTMQELSDTVGMSQSSCSRNVAALSKWHRLGSPGLDCLEAIEDPRERRRKVMYLTAKGRQRIKAALEALLGGGIEYESPTSRDAWRIEKV